MHFQEAMDLVIDKISFSKKEYEICYTDAKEIEEKFVSTFTKISPLFDSLFANSSLMTTASFQKGTKFDMVQDFQIFLPYKLPLKVKPKFRELNADKFLSLKSREKHSFVQNQYICIKRIVLQFCEIMDNTFEKIPSIVCGNGARIYAMSWRQAKIKSRIHGYTIYAEQHLHAADTNSQPQIVIRFDFILAPRFLFYDIPLPNVIAENVDGARYWMIICSFVVKGVTVFGKLTPRWQLLEAEQKESLRNGVRLFFAVASKWNEIFFDLSIQKTEVFWKIQDLGNGFANLPSSVIFTSLLSKMLNRFEEDFTPVAKYTENHSFLELSREFKAMNKVIKGYEEADSVNIEEVYKLFNLIDN